MKITSNRPDCRSIIGIAREAAVTLGKELKYPEIKVNGSDEEMSFEIDIQTDLCKRYCGRVVKDVKVGSSPYWMQRKLIEAGMRPINNIVDITNYVMLELGQPLHAFDLDDIKYNKMTVKMAEECEKFTTLDGVERTLTSDMLVIGNQDKTLDLAGRYMDTRYSMILCRKEGKWEGNPYPSVPSLPGAAGGRILSQNAAGSGGGGQ